MDECTPLPLSAEILVICLGPPKLKRSSSLYTPRPAPPLPWCRKLHLKAIFERV